MTTKMTDPACVEMKRRIQRELEQEYEARRSEFRSFADFLTRTAEDSPEIKAFRQRLALAQTKEV